MSETALTLVALATAAAVTGLLTGVQWWFRRLYHLEHYRWWVWTAFLATVQHLAAAVSLATGDGFSEHHPARLTLYAITQVAAFVGVVTLVAGTVAFTGGGPIDRRRAWLGVAAASVLGLAFVLTPNNRVASPMNGFLFWLVVRSVVIGTAMGWVGRRIWRQAPAGGWSPTRILGATFLAIAAVHLHHLIYGLVRLFGGDPGYPMVYGILANVVVLTAMAVAFVAVALEEERTRTLQSATQVREAEAALDRQDQRFRSMIEHSSDIITLLDEDAIFRYESPSITRVLGYSMTECLGHCAFDYIHPDDVAEARQAFQRGLHSTEPISHRFRRRHRDGSWVLLEAYGRRTEDQEVDQRPIVVINSRDVTDRDRLERQLLDAQRMESVGRLAGGVAHDFNNLLTVIKGNAQLALAALPPGSVARAEIEDVREAADRAAQLTRQLLTFARRQIAAPKVVEVNGVIDRTDRLLRRLIGETIQISTEPLDRAAFVRVDPVQLEQVLLNLAVNARDAMPAGGSLRLRVGSCVIDGREVVPSLEPGPYVTITVEDTGVGISEEVRRHLFEPFFTTKPAGAGTGLGLATSYGIIRQSGGAIEVESEPGQGSWFTVLLPEVVEPALEATTPLPSASSSGEETILVVEDDPAVRRLALVALRKLGYRVLEAADGVEALEVVTTMDDAIQLLVTDVVMPRMGGVELVERLRAIPSDLPVVFTTGYAEALRQNELPPRSVLLLKPYSPDELTSQVRRLLDQQLRPFATIGVDR